MDWCAIHLSRRWRSPRLVRHAHPTRRGRENSIARAIKIATGRSLLQSDKQTHNTRSRFGDRSYRWVSRGSTQPAGSADWWNSGDCTDVQRVEPRIEDGVNPSNSSAVVIVWSIGLDLPIQTERGQGTRRVGKYNANSGYSGAYMSRPDVRRTVILRTKRCAKQLPAVYWRHMIGRIYLFLSILFAGFQLFSPISRAQES